MTFSSDELQTFNARLLEMRQHAEQALAKLKGELDFGSDVDSDEETDESEEFANQLGVRNALTTQLDRVHKALERINGGTYGICVSCGKPIDKELLSAVPETDLCRNCKAKV